MRRGPNRDATHSEIGGYENEILLALPLSRCVGGSLFCCFAALRRIKNANDKTGDDPVDQRSAQNGRDDNDDGEQNNPALGIASLAAGDRHTCFANAEGVLRCWGEGDNGRLGYGNTLDVGDSPEHPINMDIPVGGKVLQVTSGKEHTCALLEEGNVRCWGKVIAGASER